MQLILEKINTLKKILKITDHLNFVVVNFIAI